MSACSKCHDTGARTAAFYRAGQLCDCAAGIERARLAGLSPQQRLAETTAARESLFAAQREARRARRGGAR